MKGLMVPATIGCLWAVLAAPNCLEQQKGPVTSLLPPLQEREPPRQSLFKKYFHAPSGRNGMEDYFAALDRVIPTRVTDVAVWESIKSQPDRWPSDDPARVTMIKRFGEPSKTSVLEARRKAIEGLSDVRELVRRGNSKPVECVHPKHDAETLYPELAEFKSLVRFFTCEAYVAFADGRSASGTDALLVALKLANHLPQESLIYRLVTIAMNSIVLAQIEKHLDQMSANDTRAVLNCLKEQKKWESGFADALQGELFGYEATVKFMRDNPAKGDITGFAPEGSEKLFAAMKPGEWNLYVDSFAETIRTRMQAAQEVLKEEERSWFRELNQRGWHDKDEEFPAPKTFTQAGEQSGLLWTEILSQSATAEAKYRTQQRLLRLHMRVLDYKWRMGKLPTRLEDAAPPEELQDTFGGGEFQFIPDTFGHYQLYSKGFRNTGRLDLRYRRDPNAPPGDQGDPPPK